MHKLKTAQKTRDVSSIRLISFDFGMLKTEKKTHTLNTGTAF